MKKIYSFILFTFFAAHLFSQVGSFTFDGLVRDYRIHLPAGYNSNTKYPLVFNLHGYTSQASEQELYSMMNQTSDAEKFIVVYPNGVNKAWNSGFLGGMQSTVDDIGFISALIDTMNANYSVDLNRVYSCGMSNGGYQSNRMACELSNRIAAIASVTGLITDTAAANCTLTRPMPYMQIHGTADPTVNYNGFPSSFGAEATINFWLNKNQCATNGDTVFMANTNTTDLSTVKKISYSNCSGTCKVVFYKVLNGGHTWPSALLDITSGPTNRDINANQEIWNFFKQYSLDGAVNVPVIKASIQINVFPNPTSDIIRIQSSENIQRVTINNMLGQRILEKTGNFANTEINLNGWNNGVYFIQLEGNGFKQTKRIVKE